MQFFRRLTSQLRVPFGLAGGRLFECDCVCPGCKRPVIAKQGSKTPHVAHEPDEDCAYGLETAVHLLLAAVCSSCPRVRQTQKWFPVRLAAPKCLTLALSGGFPTMWISYESGERRL